MSVFIFFLALQTTTTTTSSSICMLNCQNGSTPEIEDGCFCYCLENTYGRECENGIDEYIFKLVLKLFFLFIF